MQCNASRIRANAWREEVETEAWAARRVWLQNAHASSFHVAVLESHAEGQARAVLESPQVPAPCHNNLMLLKVLLDSLTYPF
jgi:hypothetical protein